MSTEDGMADHIDWAGRIAEAQQAEDVRAAQAAIQGNRRVDLDDLFDAWSAAQSAYGDRLNAYTRQVLTDQRRAEDRRLAADILTEAERRLRDDPVLRGRALAAAQILELRGAQHPALRHDARHFGDDMRAAAVALVAAERIALPSPSRRGAIEAAAIHLWDQLGADAAGRLEPLSWAGLLEHGKTGVMAAYRKLAERTLEAIEKAGYRLVSGAEEIPHE